MKGKTVVNTPRTASSPKFAERFTLTLNNKPRRSLLPQKSPTAPVEVTRPFQPPLPLTAKDLTTGHRPQPPLTLDRVPVSTPSNTRKTMTDMFRSLSPTHRDLTQNSSQRIHTKNNSIDKMRGRVENYAVGRQLGQGAYAVVHLGTHKQTKEKVAIKTYEKAKLTDAHKKLGVKREIAILEKLSHEHIVYLVEAIDTRDKISIVMEYVCGQSLHGYLKQRANRRLDPIEARRVFKQVVSAVEYCHSQNVTHRDLKLENILLNEQTNIKLIDFGFSTCYPPDKKTSTFCGTPSYMAPEIVGRREYLGAPADVWALGVLLYTMLCGCFPFKGNNDADLYRKIQKGVFSVPEFIEEGPKRLLRQILTHDPSKRPSASEVLRDEWLETGHSPPPPNESQRGEVSTHETDLLESVISLGRLGCSGNTTTLLIKPATAAKGRLARKLTAPIIKVESLMSKKRTSSQGRLVK